MHAGLANQCKKPEPRAIQKELGSGAVITSVLLNGNILAVVGGPSVLSVIVLRKSPMEEEEPIDSK